MKESYQVTALFEFLKIPARTHTTARGRVNCATDSLSSDIFIRPDYADLPTRTATLMTPAACPTVKSSIFEVVRRRIVTVCNSSVC